MGCPQAGARITQVPKYALTVRAANHDWHNSISTDISTTWALAVVPICTGPRPEPISGPTYTVPHPTGMHRWPPFASLLTISSIL
ncbi:hypothetical protein Hanom_Chr04g00345121 [Helianthus anomalus]